MNGDPRVLAGLQSAYLASNDLIVRIFMQAAWNRANGRNTLPPGDAIDAQIRAWEPPAAEPARSDRVDALEDLTQSLKKIIDTFVLPTAPDDHTPGQYKRARGCAPPVNPAPDDLVCGRCGHPGSMHHPGFPCDGPGCDCAGFVSAPPAAPLDPVLVKLQEVYENTEDDSETHAAVRRVWRFLKFGYIGSEGLVESSIRAYGKAVPS